LRGRFISSNTPSDGQVLQWDGNGNQWIPQTPSTGGTTYTQGTGISITGNTISNTGDTNASDDITTTTLSDGDINGRFTNLIINSIQGRTLSAANPTNGQVLTYNSGIAQWTPQTPTTGGTTYTAGTGISISSNTITNSSPSKWTSVGGGIASTLSIVGIGMNPIDPIPLSVASFPNTASITIGSTSKVTIGADVSGNGYLVSNSASGSNRVLVGAGSSGNGSITLYNNSNVGMIRISGTGSSGNGAVSILDASGNPGKAYMQLNGTQGDIFANMITKNGGTFKIDHPQDPANKYLYHSFVESPDMMNIYNGNIKTDVNGDALVPLPSYFEAENIDFKYQLTVIGQFAQAIVWEKVKDNKFKIKTDKPNVEVSWQVIGVRNDVWAQKYRVIPEVEKEKENKGRYMNPDLFGESADKSIMINQDLPKESKQNKAVVEKRDEKLKNTEGVKN
jgi:hypothetical protein